MTTPQQPGVNPEGEAEVIEDLPVSADGVQQVAGGALQAYVSTPGQKSGKIE